MMRDPNDEKKKVTTGKEGYQGRGGRKGITRGYQDKPGLK